MNIVPLVRFPPAKPAVNYDRQYGDSRMKFMISINSLIRGRMHQVTAYLVTLYYLEIIFLMFSLLFLYGKLAAIGAGMLLTILLAYHIIQIYFRKNLHRKIQLFIIDIHASFAVGYLFYNTARGLESDPAALFIFITRTVILIFELMLLFVLTRDEVVAGFSRSG